MTSLIILFRGINQWRQISCLKSELISTVSNWKYINLLSYTNREETFIQLSLCRCLSGGGGVSIILLGENLRKLSAQNNSRFGLDHLGQLNLPSYDRKTCGKLLVWEGETKWEINQTESQLERLFQCLWHEEKLF